MLDCNHPNLTIDERLNQWTMQTRLADEAMKRSHECLLGGIYRCADCGKTITIHVASAYSVKETKNGL